MNCYNHSPIPIFDEHPLSGGFSGSELLETVASILSHNRGSVLCTTLCTEEGRRPPEQSLVRQAEQETRDVNAFLLDAPIGKDGRLNWVLDALLKKAMEVSHTVHPISLRFDILDPREKENHPDEGKKIIAGDTTYYADPMYDYGIIIGIPNPFNPRAFALIMAGIHAPASHAAVQIMTHPFELCRLAKTLGVAESKVEDDLLFEAIFRVNRTYRPTMLGSPTWLYTRRLWRRRERHAKRHYSTHALH